LSFDLLREATEEVFDRDFCEEEEEEVLDTKARAKVPFSGFCPPNKPRL